MIDITLASLLVVMLGVLVFIAGCLLGLWFRPGA